MKQPTLPIKFSYKVQDGFYAGEYPFEIDFFEGRQKLNQILRFGITDFIDLTTKEEKLNDYTKTLTMKNVERLHFPTPDMQVPKFDTLHKIHQAIRNQIGSKRKVYLHCKGGYDRTGAVVATWFIYNGMTPVQAKQAYMQVFTPYPQREKYLYRPCLIETDWTPLSQYQKWLTKNTRKV